MKLPQLLPARDSLHLAAPAHPIGRTRLGPIVLVTRSNEPTVRTFLTAIAREQPLPIYYQGGAQPGRLRYFVPRRLFRFEPGGPIRATGHCSVRGATRTLRLDRVSLA